MSNLKQIWATAVIEDICYSSGTIYALTDACEVVELKWAGFLKLDVLDTVYYKPDTLELHPRHHAIGAEALRLFQEQITSGGK